jgi:hypothetical protein
MIDRRSLRLSATLLLVGDLLFILVDLLHPAREDPNNHTAVFTEYAASAPWTVIHLGQFLTMAIIIAGLLALFFALDVRAGMGGWAARFAAVAAGVALALTAVLQAVDGVALKQAVDAWAGAPVAEQAARFASTEAIRWLEWGVRSYQRLMLGLSLVLFAVVIVRTGRISRPIGYLMGLSGLAYAVQGVVVGAEGFSATGTVPQLLAFLFDLIWMIWLAIIAWRMKEPAPIIDRTG